MNKWLNNSAPFLILSLILCIGLGISLGVTDKAAMHLWLNGVHTTAGDIFFRYYTYVGEWVPYVVVALLLFYKAGWSVFLLVDVLLSGGLGQLLKYWADTDRPYKWFETYYPTIQLPFVDGVELSKWYSFPSGHTTTFFAMFFTLALVWISSTKPTAIRQNLISALCFVLALIGAYSRIYLNQHFAEDILGGVILGIVTTIGLLCAIPSLEKTKFWNWNLLQLSKKSQ